MDKPHGKDESWVVKLVHLIHLFSQLELMVDGYVSRHGSAPASYVYLLELVVKQMSTMLDGDASILQKLEISTKKYLSKTLEDKPKCPETCEDLLKKSKNTIVGTPKKVDPYDAIIDKYLEKKAQSEKKRKNDKRRPTK